MDYKTMSAKPYRYKKAVILGAAGFIGTNLAHALATEGFDLVCFDQVISPHWPESAIAITGDFVSLPAELLKELDLALIFHLVGSCRPSPSTMLAADEVSQDLVTTIRYLEETKTRKLRWVFLSSGGTVYGPRGDKQISETTPTDPICSYGVVKLSIESYFALYRRMHNIDSVVVRLANPYGPWQSPLKGQGIIAAMVYKALKGDTLEIWGDGENVRDYIYIADVIAGVLAAALAGRAGEIYNIGTGRGLSINKLIEIVRSALDTRLTVKYFAARSIDIRRNVLDATKLSSETGWKPKTTINSGVELTAAWLRQYIEM